MAEPARRVSDRALLVLSRDAAGGEGLSLNLIAQFDNPTNAPVKVEAFHLEVARSSSGEKLVDLRAAEVPATVPGSNRLDGARRRARDQIASLVASYCARARQRHRRREYRAPRSRPTSGGSTGTSGADDRGGWSLRSPRSVSAGGLQPKVSVDDEPLPPPLGAQVRAATTVSTASSRRSGNPPRRSEGLRRSLPAGDELLVVRTARARDATPVNVFPNNPNGMCPGRAATRLASRSIRPVRRPRLERVGEARRVDCVAGRRELGHLGCEACRRSCGSSRRWS